MVFAIGGLPDEKRGLKIVILWQDLLDESCTGESANLLVKVDSRSADAGRLFACEQRCVDLAIDVVAVEWLERIVAEQLEVDDLGLDAIVVDPFGSDSMAIDCLVLGVAPFGFDFAVFHRALVAVDLDFYADCNLRLPLPPDLTDKV